MRSAFPPLLLGEIAENREKLTDSGEPPSAHPGLVRQVVGIVSVRIFSVRHAENARFIR